MQWNACDRRHPACTPALEANATAASAPDGQRRNRIRRTIIALARLQDIADALGVELKESGLAYAREHRERLSPEHAMEDEREHCGRGAWRDTGSDASEMDAMFTPLAE